MRISTHTTRYSLRYQMPSLTARLTYVTSVTLLVAFLVTWSGFLKADELQPAPNIELKPEQVIEIVIEALKTNDAEKNDDGIATVFRFASPKNKTMTGPIERFSRMIKGGFSDMLNHVESEFGEIEIHDNVALQSVWLTSKSGNQVGYVFQVGKQTDEQFNGMWMTESVWPIGVRKPKGQSI